MGRAKEFRQRLRYTVASARHKTLEHQLSVQLERELGMSRVEAGLMSLRLSRWIVAQPEVLAPNQMLFEAQAGRRSFGRGRLTAGKTIRLTPFDAEDLELEEEFGLEALQLGRMLRLVEEAERQDALLSAKQLTLLLNISPSSLRRRVGEVRERGIWVPLRGLSHQAQERGGLYRSSWVLSGYLKRQPVERLRRQAGISRSRFAELAGALSALAELRRRGEELEGDPETAQWTELLEGLSPERLAELAATRPGGPPPTSGDWQSFSRHLREDFALSPAKLRAITDLVEEVLSSLRDGRRPGQVAYWAVAADEPAGKPLASCRLVPVKLSYWEDSDDPDRSVNRDANRVRDVKIARIGRLAQEAKRAGAYLTYADLGYLLGIHTAAISRLVRDASPEPVPLRGSECDIGRGISHRTRVIELYMQMHTESEIVSRTGHSYESIENYLKDFARCLVLRERGLAPTMIRRVTGRSMALVKAYLELADHYSTPDHALRRHQLLRVFYRPENGRPQKTVGCVER